MILYFWFLTNESWAACCPLPSLPLGLKYRSVEWHSPGLLTHCSAYLKALQLVMVSASIPEPGQGNGRPWTQSWHNCWHQRQSDEMDPNGAKPPSLPQCTQQRNVEPAEKREDKKPSFDDRFDERRNIRCNMVQHGATNAMLRLELGEHQDCQSQPSY